MNNLPIFVFFLALGTYAQESDWQLVDAEGCSALIEMPGTPESSYENYEAGPEPSLGEYTYIFIQSDERGSFILRCMVFPEGGLSSGNPQAILDSGVQMFAGDVGGEIVNNNDCRYGEHPGREFVIAANQLYLYNRTFIIGDILYHLGVSMPEQNSAERNDEIGRFFGSFEIKQ